MSTVIDNIEKAQLRKGLPSFEPGDRVRVHFQVIEGTRRRTQVFEGVVLRRQGSGLRETFTVRKQSFGVGVERTFPLHSPKIEQLEVAARGDVRRAKLYYLRDRIGKAARVTERRWGADDVPNGDVADEVQADQAEAQVEAPDLEAAEAPEAEAAEAPEAEATEAPEASDSAEAEVDQEAAEAEAESEADAEMEAKAEDAAETEDEAESGADGTSDEADESKA